MSDQQTIADLRKDAGSAVLKAEWGMEPEAIIRTFYKAALGREPDAEGLEHWRKIVETAGDPSIVLDGLLGSSEFRNKIEGRIAEIKARDSLFHFHSSFDADEIIRLHAVPDLVPNSSYLTNFLGVLINPDHFGMLLAGRRGQVEDLPIPANWHADMAEWGTALRAVDLAIGSFTMIELGCGWGCWMNNTGIAARRSGLDVHLIGVEGDTGHIEFARQSLKANGFHPDQIKLHHGLAAASAGTALFPRQAHSGVSWGLEPIFGASDAETAEALRSGSHDVLTMIPMAELITDHERIDLLHIDIQGGEASLVAESLEVLNDKVAYILIGTHSRQIEGKLLETLLAAGWWLEMERPAIISVDRWGPVVRIDGVQGWRNPRLLP